MSARPIRTTVTVVFRPPDTASSVSLEHYRQEMQMNLHRLLMHALAGCQVVNLVVDAEYVQE